MTSKHPLKDLQEKVATLLRPVQHPRIGSLMALSEELGELYKILLDHEVYGQELKKEDLEEEFADLLISLFECASLYEVNLEESLERKLKKITPKIPKWEKTFGPRLKECRERWDS